MSYIEFDFSRFYTGFYRNPNGWVFGFIRYVKKEEDMSQLISSILNDVKDV